MKRTYTHFIPQNTAPLGAKRIGVYDKDDKRVLNIPLGGLTPPSGAPLYSFGLVSDCHTFLSLTNWNGNAKLDNALTYFENHGCAMVIGCGDFTQTGFYRKNDSSESITLDDGRVIAAKEVYFDDRQMTTYQAILAKHTIPVFEMFGNHENYNSKDITLHLDLAKEYTGIPATAYTVSSAPSTDVVTGTTVRPNRQAAAVGDDLFIFLGQPSAGYVMSADDFTWFETMLEDNKDRRCFVCIHSYMEGDSGDADDRRENSIFEMWGATKTNAFIALMQKYKNTILFHGHSHMKYACQELSSIANYSEVKGYKSIHVPSLGMPRDVDEDQTASYDTPEDTAASQCYVVDVYSNGMHLRGIDMITGEFLPIASYWIDTEEVT